MGRKINTFSKAIKHLKSSKYDMLEAAPTNNTMGFMSKDVHGFDTELSPDTRTYASPDFTQDDSADDTSGLFEADGTPKTALPGGDTSYILGPMSAMWYAWANYTQIGYIREADRRMVNLGRIGGQLGSWDQESNFTSYGQLTLEQAQWFYNVKKYNNADNDTPNYRAFYPGPPSNTPDEDGRYWCVITGEPKQTGGSPPVDGKKPPTPDSWDPGDIPPELAGYGLVGLLAALASFLGMSLNAAKEWWDNATPEERQRIMDLLNPPDVATVPSGPNSPLPAPGWTPRPGSNFRPGPMWNAPKPGGGSGTWGTTIKLAHHQPQGKVLSESRKTQILKNLKSPVVIPEEQKKFKVKPKIRGLKTVVSKPVETPKQYKKVGGRNLWGKAEYDYNTRQSQERKNETLELLGASDHHWEYMTETSKKKNAEEMAKFYGDHPDLYTYTFGGKKQKVLRKEQLKGDYLVFLVDENGMKSNMLQSKLNEKLVEEEDKKFLDQYNKTNPKPKQPKEVILKRASTLSKNRVSYENDPLFKKIANRLNKEIDYKDKPAKFGFPDNPPPEMVNDRHPDFGKRPGTSMFNRLDPQTAKAMPKQDDETIDAKVAQAKENPKRGKFNKEELEKSDWKKELNLNERMTTGCMYSSLSGSEDNPTEVTDINTTTADSFEDSEDNALEHMMFKATDIGASGTGSGDDGGFNIGSHLAVGTETNSDGSAYQATSTRHALLKPIDARYIDTMVVTAIRGNGSNGGKLPTSGHIDGQDLRLMWFNEDRVDGWQGIGSWMKINVSGKSPHWTYNKNEDNSDYNSIIIPRYHFKLEYGNEYDLADPEAYPELREWTIKIPEWCRNKNQRFAFYQYYIGFGGFNYGIKSIKYQRRTPMNVAIPLDSPEASSFVRLGQSPSERTSPKKRNKKVDRILKASKKYVNKVVGDPFPGTGAKIGEAQGTSGSEYVRQQWDDKKQEFGDIGTLDQQKDKFVSKDVKLAPTYSQVQKAKKKK